MTINQETVHDNEATENTVEEKETILSYVKETEQRLSDKAEIRNKNQNIQNFRPSEASFSKLDSSLKKNTTFVKKLKNFSASQVDSLIKDIQGLNLTKYISEVAAALVDAKLKMTDVGPAVKLCCLLHETYAEFSHHLFENWQKILSIKVGDKIANPSKLRVDLRFYAELVSAGLFNNKTAFSLLGSILTTLINMDKEEHYNISIILSFCRHCGDDYAGLITRKYRELSEKYEITIPRSNFLPAEKQQNVRSLLREYYNSLCRHLIKEHNEMQEFERQNRRILQTKGELNQDRRDKLDSMRVNYDKLVTSTQNFSDVLDESMPTLATAEATPDSDAVVVSAIRGAVSEGDIGDVTTFSAEAVWCDVDTRRFYCELPDLQVFLPASYTPKHVQTPPAQETLTEEVLDAEIPQDEDIDETALKTDDITVEDETEDSTSTTISNKIVLDAFLNNLSNCINREMIDNAAIDFLVTLNNKHNRKKLVRSLFGVNRTRLDLLPFYARFVAILQPAIPEVGTELCQLLRQDFKYHVRKKDQINIESKIKVVRYIGELVKFSLYAKLEALFCIKVLLHDFSHHHIEMACNLLEVCGRYLFCHADTHQRTKIYLEQMMRKKAVLALDSRYVTQIENAYYYVNPPDTVAVPRKERPVMHQFIRKLLYQDLQKNNTDKILRLMRKLDWSSEETAAYAIKCLTNAYNVKYFNIRCLANLLAGLVAYQEEVGTRVVDGVLEDIRLGMEVNLPKYYQRRVAQIKYLGELYNYRMVESADIFKVLYSLISFGITMSHDVPSPLDPPDNTFRIRLACVLLDTSGTYFSSGSSKRRLDYYLVFLQAYYWFKRTDPIWQGTFPVSVDYLLRDTLSALRPKLTAFENYEQAQQEVENVRKTLGWAGEDETQNNQTRGLDSIAETDTELDEDVENEVSEAVDDATTTEDEVEEETDDGEADREREDSDEEDSNAQDVSAVDTETAALPSGPKHVNCTEDEDFVSALERMVSDNIQDRMRDSVKPSQLDISVPMSVRSSKKTYEQIRDTTPMAANTMNFTLMIRKGNKQVYRSFKADVDSELAQNLRDQEMAVLAEKQCVKRLTLNITERLEEEDYQEMLQAQQRPTTMNLNRERKKYQHPKGAPDADLIFGPKRVR